MRGGDTRVRAPQAMVTPRAGDPACYLTENEIKSISGRVEMTGSMMAGYLPGRFAVDKGISNERQDYKNGQARRE